ncbi:hypothetical protein DN752_18025 [Echinicola strongylocentroti]|uniref:CHAD domain-containing protein n=1 Tax=Echinicola strongylocentroti TaxID=1795355 RepID=A0A2Z4IMB6_9BACT|nr:hypothetical protein [Echinicola strongylocentroti]AWW31879.1 hypothetical protein DN752_18025 [Echinicola strongylocentroti]
MKACIQLKKFANAREKAYQAVGKMNGKRAKAITKIKLIAGHYARESDMVQLRAVNQVQGYIMELLPTAESNFKNQRAEMLNLIDQAKSLQKCTNQTLAY